MRVSTVATILSATAVAILAFPAEASEADIAGPRQRSLRGIDRHLKDKGASSRVFNAGVEPKGAQPKGAQPNGAQPATDGARDQMIAPYIPTGAKKPTKDGWKEKRSGVNAVTPPSAKSEPVASRTLWEGRASA